MLFRLAGWGAALVIAACSPVPVASESAAGSSFASGTIYTTTAPVQVQQRGKVLMLAGDRSGEQTDFPDTVRVGELPAGTRVRVQGTQRINTLTHGDLTWPEGVILDGPFAGRRVAMARDDLRRSFRADAGAAR